jgi:hypothetical protein
MNPFVVDAEVLDPEWRFESIITMPDETRVQVIVTVPERVAWADVRETAEIIQMSANGVVSHITRSRVYDQEGKR